MRTLLSTLSVLLLAAPALAQDRAAYVTLLGSDTLAVERFQHHADGMTAEVVLRTPRTTVRTYDIRFDDAGNITRYEAVTRGEDTRTDVIEPGVEGLQVTTTTGPGSEVNVVAGDPSMLPFIDMVHWPFELALMRFAETGHESAEFPMFTARNPVAFELSRHADGTMSVRHPFRGAMDVEVNEVGQIVRLDAGQTTRALTVNRVDDVDIDAIAARFQAEDAAGRSFGALSGRGAEEATVHGANISVDYGQPAKRGREIWGGLVRHGHLWRTGANRATHIETDRTLVFGDLEVPPGTYTLFSIPEADGGTLIINSQTGQNGNSYDASQDFGRVPMMARSLDSTVELFTITVSEEGNRGALRLQWDDNELVALFEVR
jgi:hypothetical protein